MSDKRNIKEFAEKLNEQEPIDIEKLREAFDQIFYKEPEGNNPIEAKHVSGLTIRSPESTEDLVQKLRAAKKAKPSFIQIGNQDYNFDSKISLSRLIDGIRLGSITKE